MFQDVKWQDARTHARAEQQQIALHVVQQLKREARVAGVNEQVPMESDVVGVAKSEGNPSGHSASASDALPPSALPSSRVPACALLYRNSQSVETITFKIDITPNNGLSGSMACMLTDAEEVSERHPATSSGVCIVSKATSISFCRRRYLQDNSHGSNVE